MMTRVFKDVIPFIVVFLLYIIIFSIMNEIIESDFDAGDYDKIPRFIIFLFSNFRIAIGDMHVPTDGKWENTDNTNKDFESAKLIAVLIIWLIWFVNVFGMMIVLTNFLVSEVGVTYENVINDGNTLLYREKANFNLLVF